MSIKTIQLICNALQMTSFCMIRVSAERYFQMNCVLQSQEILSFTYHTYQAGNDMFKVNSKNFSIRRGICSKIRRKTPERHQLTLFYYCCSIPWAIIDKLSYCFCCWFWASNASCDSSFVSSTNTNLSIANWYDQFIISQWLLYTFLQTVTCSK